MTQSQPDVAEFSEFSKLPESSKRSGTGSCRWRQRWEYQISQAGLRDYLRRVRVSAFGSAAGVYHNWISFGFGR